MKTGAQYGNTNSKTHEHSSPRNPTYRSWEAMRERVLNPKATNYKYYGGRGIKIQSDWSKFENFLRDMGERPRGKSLDRVNNDGDYEFYNCRWATPRQQASHRRSGWITRRAKCKN